jgi:hypothetical protein
VQAGQLEDEDEERVAAAPVAGATYPGHSGGHRPAVGGRLGRQRCERHAPGPGR